jgi:periplasmic copper chaperone A
MRRRILLAGFMVCPLVAAAQPASIKLDDVWSRAAMAGRIGVVYLTITAIGAPDTLLGASTPVAARAELHESIDDQGVMKMRPVASLPVEPGKPLVFDPGRYHIMLVDLARALKEGDSFPITLRFAKAGAVTATVCVQKAGAAEMKAPPGDSAMPGMKM